MSYEWTVVIVTLIAIYAVFGGAIYIMWPKKPKK